MSNKTLYKLTRDGTEVAKVSLSRISPTPNMGLTWDGTNFWVGNSGANRMMRVTPDGVQTASQRPDGGKHRDVAWDGEHLLLVYKQDDTV